MTYLQRTNKSDRKDPGVDSPRCRSRMRRHTIALLLILGLMAPACTPGQIETSMERLAVSFEQGAVERDLLEAVFVVNNAIPEIGMLLGYPFGP